MALSNTSVKEKNGVIRGTVTDRKGGPNSNDQLKPLKAASSSERGSRSDKFKPMGGMSYSHHH